MYYSNCLLKSSNDSISRMVKQKRDHMNIFYKAEGPDLQLELTNLNNRAVLKKCYSWYALNSGWPHAHLNPFYI
jgi:hypothetical protein